MTMARADLRKLQAKEIGYRLETATVRPYAPGDPSARGAFPAGPHGHVQAQVFVSDPMVLLRESLPPRLEYANKLRDGARENGVDPGYRELLDTLPTLQPDASRGALPPEYGDTKNAAVGKAFLVAAGVAVLGAFLR